MNTPSDDEISADARWLVNDTDYLDAVSFGRKLIDFLLQSFAHPLRTLRCMRIALSARPMKGARDYARLLYHFIEAGFLARKYRNSGFEHIHCHFINGPTSIGMFLGQMLDIPFSFTMHASMIWLDPIALHNKLATCKFCASISDYNKRYVVKTYGAEFEQKIHIVHCGIDPEISALPNLSSGEADEVRVLGLGQLNPRKGFHVLVKAAALLKDRLPGLRCTIVGGGEQREELEQAIASSQLEGRVELTGAVPHEQVQTYLGACDMFVLPCVVSDDGWRDGIPVALMEAMFHRRPVISTDILGLPELIENGKSGLLVPSDNAESLADAIEQLAADPELRRHMGEQGRNKVLQAFNNDLSVRELSGLFDAP